MDRPHPPGGGGCSNFLTYQLVRAIGRTETLGLTRLDCVQPGYNLSTSSPNQYRMGDDPR